jgi:hypothetical protein
MRKIYTEIVLKFNGKLQKYEKTKEKYYFSDEKITFCGGGPDVPDQPTQTTTVQKSEPWDGQKGYLQTGFAKAQQSTLDRGAPNYYPSSTVVPFSPETQTALDFQAQRAIAGSPVQSAANQQLFDTLNGGYIGGFNQVYQDPTQSPAFNAQFDAAARRIIPQVDSAFEGSGRLNSGLAQQAKTQALSDAFAGQYMQDKQLQLSDYQAERQNQLRGMLFAPQMLQQDYVDASKLAEVGAQKEALQGEYLGESMDRYNYDQTKDMQNTANFLSLINGNYGGSVSSTSTGPGQVRSSGGNPVGGALGGALAGGSMFGPWGALGGGLLGLAGGLF